MIDVCKEMKDIKEKSGKSILREIVCVNWYWFLKLFFLILFLIEKIIFMNLKVCVLLLFKCR